MKSPVNLRSAEELCIWNYSSQVRELYRRRCRQEVEEMDCAAQAAELLCSVFSEEDIVVDVGCGSGYFYHSMRERDIRCAYFGLDQSAQLIEIGREEMNQFGLSAENLIIGRIENADFNCDHVICMNVLSNLPNFHEPLHRILSGARKTVILRESLGDKASYLYVRDKYLECNDPLFVHVNTYDLLEFIRYIESYGFKVTSIIDQRTKGRAEKVIDYDHYWHFIMAQRELI